MLVKYWDKYTEMQHGQQNVKKKEYIYFIGGQVQTLST